VRVWDLAGTDQTLKTEVKALGGRINALAWDSESKRIVVGGDGRDRFAHAFMFDSGSSVGELVSIAPQLTVIPLISELVWTFQSHQRGRSPSAKALPSCNRRR
jgi:hypothetical protein